jgi:hypothetical protein
MHMGYKPSRPSLLLYDRYHLRIETIRLGAPSLGSGVVLWRVPRSHSQETWKHRV